MPMRYWKVNISSVRLPGDAAMSMRAHAADELPVTRRYFISRSHY